VRLAVNNEHKVGPHEEPDEDPDTGDEIPWDLLEPSTADVREQGRFLERRQQEFLGAARRVAAAFAEIPSVQRVVLFGSVAVPLPVEIPRFREFRRAGIALPHECRDVDLAVWLDELTDLPRLRIARSRSLNELHAETGIGVAHHQVDVFLIEPGTDRYLGRLCTFNKCPKGKPECRVPGCGATRFLRRIEGFALRPDALLPERIVALFDREEV
jgi:hypothetical protein